MLISIVYDSGYGHTARVAKAVASGIEQVDGTRANLVCVADGPVDWEALEQSAGIIFGSPTYNGSPSARFKQFCEDSTRPAWRDLKWHDKVAAGFTNSGAMHGDKLHSLVSMALFAAQHGMLWVGLDLFPGTDAASLNRIGGWLGAMAQSDDASPEITPIQSDLDTAAHLGRRVAQIARRLTAA
ncbi:flavodoxin family protein [Sphingomonas pituitosa]|uniref:flavodoxin family protein n=1 Tax=Sphingomonas pituitosa TaxID=99597 RepID=UPI00083765BB|nr:flavodoxin family protein [Sphingomonas pituitosa]